MRAAERDIEYTVQKMDTVRKKVFVPMPSKNTKISRDIPVRESLSWFSEKMEKELRAFDRFISPWETEFALALLDDLDEQVIELHSRILSAMGSTQHKMKQAVIDRCVQVANLAHMIASSHHPILSHRRNGKTVH